VRRKEEEVLVTMGIRKGGKMIPVTMWKGHKVGIRIYGEQLFSGPGGDRRFLKTMRSGKEWWDRCLVATWVGEEVKKGLMWTGSVVYE
jgi:hypothetical protein